MIQNDARVKIPFDPNLIQNNTITKRGGNREILASSSFFVIVYQFTSDSSILYPVGSNNAYVYAGSLHP